MKRVGNIDYPWYCGSPTDGKAMGFHSKEAAERHSDAMAVLLKHYDDNENDCLWNKKYWTTKPEPWVVISASEFTE